MAARSDENLTAGDEACGMTQSGFISAQYWLIAVCGTTICVIGIGFNIALLQVLFQRKLRTSYLIYLAVLAIMDILILITYILVPVVGVLYEYYESYFLYRFWHSVVKYFYTLSRIVTLASTYLVLACTVERYWEVLQLHSPSAKTRGMTQSHRYVRIACVVLGTIVFRFCVLFELKIVENPDCYGTLSYVALDRTELVKEYFYSEIYSFWIVHVVQVFFPFPLLIVLNVLIIFGWRSVLKNRRKQSVEMKRLMERSQSARKMMISIVTSYLACNTLQMIITCWEHISMEFLEEHRDFYAFASDVVTLLTAINASSRLPIYYHSNSTIRSAIRELWLSRQVQDLVHAGSLRTRSSISSLQRKQSVLLRTQCINRKQPFSRFDIGQENCCMLADSV